MVAREGVSGITPPLDLTRVAPLSPASSRLVRLLVVALLMAPAAWANDGADGYVDPYLNCPEVEAQQGGCAWVAGCPIQPGTPKLGTEYLRCGEVTTVQATSTMDFDHCTSTEGHDHPHFTCLVCYAAPAWFDNVLLVPDWSHDGVDGEFGHLDANGVFEPGTPVTHFRAGDTPGVVSIEARHEDVGIYADDEAQSAAKSITVWDLTIEPADEAAYAAWRPNALAGATPEAVDLVVELHPETDHTGAALQGIISIFLTGASHEAGYCLNATYTGPDPWLQTDAQQSDLKFDPNEAGYTVEAGLTGLPYTRATKQTASRRAELPLYCFDCGAFACVTATINELKPGLPVSPSQLARRRGTPIDKKRFGLLVPLDDVGDGLNNDGDEEVDEDVYDGQDNDGDGLTDEDGGNHIADAWAHDAGAAEDDAEPHPAGQGVPGDGFSRYDEYRGWRWTDQAGQNPDHLATDPDVEKDLFVLQFPGPTYPGQEVFPLSLNYFSLGYTVHAAPLLPAPPYYPLAAVAGEPPRATICSFGSSFRGAMHYAVLVMLTFQTLPPVGQPPVPRAGATVGWLGDANGVFCVVDVGNILTAGLTYHHADVTLAHELGHALAILPSSGGGHCHNPSKPNPDCIMDNLAATLSTTFCSTQNGHPDPPCTISHTLLAAGDQ